MGELERWQELGGGRHTFLMFCATFVLTGLFFTDRLIGINHPGGQASSDKGSHGQPSGPFTFGLQTHLPGQMRTGFYIDGFNLYHAIAAFRDDSLKWLNLKSLTESYLRDGDVEVKTTYFTAINSWDADKRRRHLAYVEALESFGVTVHRSNFDKVSKFCYRHNRYCPMREEKQTDVALGVAMLAECYQLGLERIVLVTADSDQIPSVKAIKGAFPGTTIFLVAPPKRLAVARQLGSECDGVAELTEGRIRQHQLPEVIRDGGGRLIAQRPVLYGGVNAVVT